MTAGAGVVTSVRVDHETATLERIEAASAANPDERLSALLERPAVEEAFVLQTCHRAEAYVVTSGYDTGKRALEGVIDPGSNGQYADHHNSLRHLLAVAAGLESVVLGEDQILGQVRQAVERAKENDALGPLLEAVVLKAIHVGERARTETAINDGATSLAGAAVRFAAEHRSLEEATALVVGAGEMGRLAAEALASRVAHVTVVNRTPARAETVIEELPNDISTRAAGLDHLETSLSAADVAITATNAQEPVVPPASIADCGDLVLIDLARPRDVPQAAIPNSVDQYDLEDVEAVTDQTAAARQAAAETVESLVQTELENLLEQLKRSRADEVIAGMYESAEALKRREVRQALDRMTANGELSAEQRAAVEDLADSLVNQLLAAPTRSLRDAAGEDDWETIDTALRLFEPEFDDGSPFPGQKTDTQRKTADGDED